jgi:hypothetical protein
VKQSSLHSRGLSAREARTVHGTSTRLSGVDGRTVQCSTPTKWRTVRNQGWIVRKQRTKNHTEQTKFWTLFHSEWRTVRGLISDCPWFKNQKTHRAKSCSSRTPIGGLSAGQARAVYESRKEQKSGDFKSPPPSVLQFVAKSTPTATKLCEHDHKAVGELSLRDHCPI